MILWEIDLRNAGFNDFADRFRCETGKRNSFFRRNIAIGNILFKPCRIMPLIVFESRIAENPEQPEPHLILRDNGQASGSDGCNNFFMNWKRKNESISFSDGGSTLRMCPQGEEQAREMHAMFAKADEWNINGSMLELRSKKSIVAVFEAVDM